MRGGRVKYFIPQELGKFLNDENVEKVQSGLEVNDLGVEFVGGYISGVCCGVEEGVYKGGVTYRAP